MKRDMKAIFPHWIAVNDRFPELKNQHLKLSQYFELSFDQDLADLIATETYRYDSQENDSFKKIKHLSY